MLRREREIKSGQQNLFSKKYSNEEIFGAIRNIDAELVRSRNMLRSEFRKFDSLSPFREPPRRTYLFSGATPSEVGRNGENAIDILVSDTSRRGRGKSAILEKVSKYFKECNIAESIKLNPLTTRHYEISLFTKNGQGHNLCDVGFGCSQVILVLVGTLNVFDNKRDHEEGIFVVQEPEIHLHPNAQAELGSFFAENISNRSQIFIETHSPNLILRMQKLIADGVLDPNDLRVFYVSPTNIPPTVTVLKPGSDGIFESDWPEGFFPQRQTESLALAKSAFLKKSRNVGI